MNKNQIYIGLGILAVFGFIIYNESKKKALKGGSESTEPISEDPVSSSDLTPTQEQPNKPSNCQAIIGGHLMSRCSFGIPQNLGGGQTMAITYYYNKQKGKCEMLSSGGGAFNSLRGCQKCCGK